MPFGVFVNIWLHPQERVLRVLPRWFARAEAMQAAFDQQRAQGDLFGS